MTEPSLFRLPRWAPLAATAAVGAAGLAAVAVARRREPAVTEAPLPPSPPPPRPEAGTPSPFRFRAILVAMALGVLAVWTFAIHTNAMAEVACVEARERADFRDDDWRTDYRDGSGLGLTFSYDVLAACVYRR
ncbi:hypothetical protein Aph02nite_10090 [Actinoplanes philippinensis]|uniref:hypothetical protein n=1 Tax=Actinoplanes philippinensis TaxID=35752 RepID=UPI001160C272|nr:hypothetical protein [Actinoplanes philippinensis]GIE75059.1 hypothetical protein Aph02nite_10090 [Actinoplanes philippinensis]